MTEIEFRALAAQGYNRIPLLAECFADLDTPLLPCHRSVCPARAALLPRIRLFRGGAGSPAGVARGLSWSTGKAIAAWYAAKRSEESLGAGARLVLHRRGIWRSKKFQA